VFVYREFDNEKVWAGFANDIWGWESDSNQEIVIVGCSIGTAFVDITNPIYPHYIGFVPTTDRFNYWRDIKVYQDYAYIGSESSRHGIQVVSLATVASDALLKKTGVMYSPVMVYYGVGKMQ
jgi:choice-of-anchor B domain-containing protein